MKTIRLTGPAGCGKTTWLLDRVAEFSSEIEDRSRIGFVSFSKAAVREARERVAKKIRTSDEDVRNWKTIHAMAFRAMGLSSEQIMTPQHWTEFGRELGLAFTPYSLKGFQTGEMDNHGDKFLMAYHYARNTMTDDWAKVADELATRIDPEDHALFAKSLAEYKARVNLIDFDDMLEIAVKERAVPRWISHLILDEGQDSTPLQTAYIRVLIEENNPDVYIVGGDPAQSIYTWSGASPEAFNAIEADEDVALTVSHRIPDQIARFARAISSEVPEFCGWGGEENHVRRSVSWKDVLAAAVDGRKTYVLGRSNYLVTGICKSLSAAGVDYLSRTDDPDYLALRSSLAHLYLSFQSPDYKIRAIDFDRMLDAFTARRGGILEHGYKARIRSEAAANPDDMIELRRQGWYGKFLVALEQDRLAWVFKPEFRSAIPRLLRLANKYGGQKLLETPNVSVMTMHASKGKEAERVILIPNLPKRVYESIIEPGPQREARRRAEARLFYVGVTRASQELMIVDPFDERFGNLQAYDLPPIPDPEGVAL